MKSLVCPYAHILPKLVHRLDLPELGENGLKRYEKFDSNFSYRNESAPISLGRFCDIDYN